MRCWPVALLTLGCEATLTKSTGPADASAPTSSSGAAVNATAAADAVSPAVEVAPTGTSDASTGAPTGPSGGPDAPTGVATSDPLSIFVDVFSSRWRLSPDWVGMLVEVVDTPAIDAHAIHCQATSAWDAAAFVHLDDSGGVVAVQPSDYAALTFEIMGSGTVYVGVEGGSGETAVVLTSSWTSQRLSMGQLVTNGLPFTRLTFKASASGQQFYLDNVAWEAAGANSYSQMPRAAASGTTQGSDGCGHSATGGTYTLGMTIAGTGRTALVVVPPDYANDKAYPIVFGFHGCTHTPEQAHGYLVSEAQAGSGAIFVYPASIELPDHCWFDGFADSPDVDVAAKAELEAQLFLQMRAKLRADYCVDMKRTFVTGFSQGALLTNNLACRFGSAEITAISPNSGSLNADRVLPFAAESKYGALPGYYGPWQVSSPDGGGAYAGAGSTLDEFMCPVDGSTSASPAPGPKLPPPALIFHGDLDTTWHVRIERGRESARHWAYVAQCTQDPVDLSIAQKTAGNTNPCAKPACAPGHEIEYCEIAGVGHSQDYDNKYPAHLTDTWAFFQKY